MAEARTVSDAEDRGGDTDRKARLSTGTPPLARWVQPVVDERGINDSPSGERAWDKRVSTGGFRIRSRTTNCAATMQSSRCYHLRTLTFRGCELIDERGH